MGVMSKLAALDRRVEPQRSPDAWRNAASRWRFLLAAAGGYVVAGLVVATTLDFAPARVLALSVVMPASVLFGFLAAQQKSEDDRLNGRDPLARRRPPGL